MSDEWYYTVNQQTFGPYTKAALGQMLSSGQINRQTLVIREGIPDWTPMEKVPELYSVYASAAPQNDFGIYNGGGSPPPGSNVSAGDLVNQGLAAYKAGDYNKANDLYRRAADMGNTTAQSNLGNSYYYGRGVAKDYTKAVELYRKSADQGNSYGQNGLGNAYRDGNGVAKDYTKAVEWYRKSADQGNATAYWNLGDVYRYGYGVPQSYTQAAECYRTAVAKGAAGAQEDLDKLKAEGKI